MGTSASFDIAATLLYPGRTVHNRFKYPFNPQNDSAYDINNQFNLAKYLSNIVLAIIEEGPMLNKFCLWALDRSMRNLTNKEKKFEGNLVLISGDFHQLLPVIENANKTTIVQHTLKLPNLWDANVVHFSLRKNIRVQRKQPRIYPRTLASSNKRAKLLINSEYISYNRIG